MLLYMVKYSRPNTNATQELSEVDNRLNKAAFLKIHYVIRYVLDTKNPGLKIEPIGDGKELWDFICFSNSNYSGDLVANQSVSGFILYVLGAPVSW